MGVVMGNGDDEHKRDLESTASPTNIFSADLHAGLYRAVGSTSPQDRNAAGDNVGSWPTPRGTSPAGRSACSAAGPPTRVMCR